MAERDGNDVDRPIQNDPDPARLHRVEVLRSEFTGQIYADRPIDRRIDAYLLHHGLTELLNDGSAYDALLECVMGQRRASFAQWSSSAAEHLGTPWRSSTLDDCRV